MKVIIACHPRHLQDLLAGGGAGGGAAGIATSSTTAAPHHQTTIQQLRAELECPTTTAAATAAAGEDPSTIKQAEQQQQPGLQPLPVEEDGQALSRTISMNGPDAMNFWRNFSRTHSLGSIPSFGLGMLPASLDGSHGNPLLEIPGAIGTAPIGGGAAAGAEGAAFGRLRSFGEERASSFERTNSGGLRKRQKISHEAQNIADQLGVLHKTSQVCVYVCMLCMDASIYSLRQYINAH